MGTLLSIAWFLLLGPLAQTPKETVFERVLSFYYPTMDTALLSCTVLLLLRGSGRVYQVKARRFALLAVGIGLAVFATSDFIFNLQQNLGTYVDGTWVDLGWPLGIMAIGVGAYLRRFTPAASNDAQERQMGRRTQQIRFEPAQVLPHLLLIVLFGILIFNVLSSDKTQQNIRAVLIAATLIVVSLVIVRQILTMVENTQLLRRQNATLQELEMLNQSIVEHNKTLESGITHLKEIQTRLANGEVRARAVNINGELWPLATGLNLMADRMMRIEQSQTRSQKLAGAIDKLIQALERMRDGSPFVPPSSCLDFPEMQRLIYALGLKPIFGTPQSAPYPTGSNPAAPSANHRKGFTRPRLDSTKPT